VLLEQDLALVHEDGGIDGMFAGTGLGRKGDADKDGGRERGGGLAQFINTRTATAQKGRLVEEIGGGISADAQLREDGETGSRIRGALAGVEDFGEVAGEVPDSGVDLGECDLHIFSVKQGLKRKKLPRA